MLVSSANKSRNKTRTLYTAYLCIRRKEVDQGYSLVVQSVLFRFDRIVCYMLYPISNIVTSNHISVVSRTPYSWSLANNIRWSTMSKALEESRNTPTTISPLSRASVILIVWKYPSREGLHIWANRYFTYCCIPPANDDMARIWIYVLLTHVGVEHWELQDKTNTNKTLKHAKIQQLTKTKYGYNKALQSITLIRS